MNIFLLHGNHSFARKKAKSDLVERYASNGTSVTNFSVSADLGVKNLLVERIRQKLTGLSLFVQKETVMINFLLPDTPSRGRKKIIIPCEFLVDMLSGLSDNTSLILDLPVEIAKSSDLYKTVKKLGGDIQLYKLAPIKDKTVLLEESKKFLARENVKIDSFFIQELISSAKGDWWRVFTSLEQIVLFYRSCNETQSPAVIQKEIRELINLQQEQNIFRLFDAIGQGNKAAALALLYENNSQESLKSGKDVEQTLGFVSLMARQLRQLIAIKSHVSPTEAQRDWQIPSFAYSKIQNQASYFSLEFLIQAYEKLVELQEKAKRGLYSPLSLVDFFILYLISHRYPSQQRR